jgi:hypothetical protein
MLFAIEMQKALTVAVDQCPGGHHFRVQQGLPRQQPPEVSAVVIAPIHHGGDGKSTVDSVHAVGVLLVCTRFSPQILKNGSSHPAVIPAF